MAEPTVKLLADGVAGYRRTVARCPRCDQPILVCRQAAGHGVIAFDDLALTGTLGEDGQTETVSAATAHRRRCTGLHPFRGFRCRRSR